ncbi:MAG TPA: class I adenylate-forming enzyme family protein [Opitutaceae bacterium]|nr:class I adenylate-forming enzyme family protein [Opitutaceae bacterium]
MPATLSEAWNRRVRAQPRAPALIDAGTRRIWTRAELDALAASWRSRHAAPLAGAAVIFAEPNGPHWLEIFLGLLQAGAVAVPLDPTEPEPARRAAARAVGADFLWHAGRLEPTGAGRRRRDGRRLIKLTSGSTGAPRPLAFTDAQLLADSRRICATMGIKPGDRSLGLIPFSHSYGFSNLVTPLLDQGTAVICGVPALPQAIASAIREWKATVFPAVPALLRALADTDMPQENLRSLRTVVSAGAPLGPETARAFYGKFGKKIHNFYGSTETGGISYDRTGAVTLSGRSIGPPLPGVRLIFQKKRRFLVESTAVFTLGNRRRRGGLGRHLPADLGQRNERGELVLLGRSGRFAKLGGRRVNLAEIEQALRRLPGVRDAFAALHPARPDALAAAVAGTGLAPEAILVALRERLAAWKIPRQLRVLPEFPLTARGKTDARRLRALLRR